MADYSQGPIAGAPVAQPGYNHANTTTPSDPENAFLSTTRPPYPPWLKFLPPLILVLTVGVIAMVGYVVHTLNDGSQGLGFNLFAGSWTLLVGTYLILAFWTMPHIHYKWIVFILSTLSCVWWLAAFAYLASNTRQSYQVINLLDQYSSYSSGYNLDLSGFGFRKRDLGVLNEVLESSRRGLEKRQYSLSYYINLLDTFRTAAAVMAGASAVGAIIWVLFVVFTVFYGISLFRGSSTASAGPIPPPAATYEPKAVAQPSYGQAQPPYPPPVATEVGFVPVRPDTTFAAPTYNTVDPRDPRMAPGAEFLTPPPPGGYANPQFGGYEADRNYTVSPLSIIEMPASQPQPVVEMPSGQR